MTLLKRKIIFWFILIIVALGLGFFVISRFEKNLQRIKKENALKQLSIIGAEENKRESTVKSSFREFKKSANELNQFLETLHQKLATSQEPVFLPTSSSSTILETLKSGVSSSSQEKQYK